MVWLLAAVGWVGFVVVWCRARRQLNERDTKEAAMVLDMRGRAEAFEQRVAKLLKENQKLHREWKITLTTSAHHAKGQFRARTERDEAIRRTDAVYRGLMDHLHSEMEAFRQSYSVPNSWWKE